MISSDFVRVWNSISNECRKENYGPNLVLYYTLLFLIPSFILGKLYDGLVYHMIYGKTSYIQKSIRKSMIRISRIIFVMIIFMNYNVFDLPSTEYVRANMLYDSSFDAINFVAIVTGYYIYLGIIYFIDDSSETPNNNQILYFAIGMTLIQLSRNFNFAIIAVFNLLGLMNFFEGFILGYIPIYAMISHWLYNANYSQLCYTDIVAIIINHLTLGVLIIRNISHTLCRWDK